MRYTRRLPVWLSVFAVAACSAPPPAAQDNPLKLPGGSPVWSDDGLFERVSATPHDYFRFVNVTFAGEVCRRFDAVMASLPTVNLHGDAHVEQIGITPEGARLVDFDDSASGPPVIDLVRFGVSLELTLVQRGWGGESSNALDQFLAGYRAGLEDGPAPSVPEVVARIQSGIERDEGSFLEWAGSATTKRYLARIEGPSPAADDDVILEAKELRDLQDVPCVSAQRGDALRVVASAVRFGGGPDPYLAVIPRGREEEPDDPAWWIQSWKPAYEELDIASSLRAVEELYAVARMAGFQMARGHTGLLPPPYDRQQRGLVEVMLDEHEFLIRGTVDDMTALTIDAHRGAIASRSER